MTPERLSEHAEAVRLACEAEARDIMLREAHPHARHPREAARHRARERRAKLAAMRADLTREVSGDAA